MELLLVLLGVVVGLALSAGWRLLGRRRHDHPRDALTGLALRDGALAALRDLRAGDAVVILDADDLKHVNDANGHAAGDAVLRALAAHLERGVRAGDTVARWGGDEFVVVLRDGAGGAAEVVERLRASAPSAFSAGFAIHAHGDGEATLARADAALLRAKRAGGARVMPA